jgi:predicted aminopeptidase
MKALSLFLLFMSLIFNLNCINYLAHLGIGQIDILRKRQKIETILNSSENIILKNKLSLVQNARIFAINKLSLNPKGGFEYYTPLNRSEIGWHVTASYPLKMESYTWWFPIVGTVPYKGYFDLEKAREEFNKLKSEGLDTKLRITAGYSTLGWFSDPLFSPQLNLPDYELISLIFHEMAHSTIYFEGDSLFNESFASFVEEKGLETYLLEINSNESREYLDQKKQNKFIRKKLISEIILTGKELEKMYLQSISDEEKYENKKLIITSFKEKISSLNKNYNSNDIERLVQSEINNETFIGFLRYESGEDYFEKKFVESNFNFKIFYNNIGNLKDINQEERKKLLLGSTL